ncbi:MAG: isoaspartyl peptidase/L-asparaginase [Saprospirales bacterium]|nr:MAG: isoaspartyl peptidase/L-asparaginase [Saprospirales bacterium]
MKKLSSRCHFVLFSVFFCLFLVSSCKDSERSFNKERVERPEFVFLVHGGAGVFHPDQLPEGREQEYLDAVNEALSIGEEILTNGGSALDAVEKAIIFLEDQPFLNAGKGAVFTAEGKNELDASIMDGQTMNAGAVGGVTTIKNPITAARKVMDQSPHVFLVGSGAEQFAASVGCEIVDPSHFFTQERFDALMRVQEANPIPEDNRGTVGAVALDRYGNLAAGTSTGGMTNKRFGRVGDSPIIGAGTYADNNGCAVSGTGHGEFFIRYAVAYDLNAKLKYQVTSLETAANEIIHHKLKEAGGSGGLIAIDKDGNYTMPFNTGGMIRGVVTPKYRKVEVY